MTCRESAREIDFRCLGRWWQVALPSSFRFVKCHLRRSRGRPKSTRERHSYGVGGRNPSVHVQDRFDFSPFCFSHECVAFCGDMPAVAMFAVLSRPQFA